MGFTELKSSIKARIKSFIKRNIADNDPYQDEIIYEVRPTNTACHAAHPIHVVPFTIKEQFMEFHTTHPEVYESLVKLAHQAQQRGFKTYSINSLVERLRWHYNIDTHNNGRKSYESYKINNSFRSHYARLIMKQEPTLAGFFNTRELHAHTEAA